jgi:hypothetical protein
MTEEQEKQESQKTLVAFVAGLLIGGLLVWVFGGSPETTTEPSQSNQEQETPAETTDNGDTVDEQSDAESAQTDEVSTRPAMQTGDGSVDVVDQPAGMSVQLDSATFPSSEGWVGVRSFPNGQIGSILGAARYSEVQGLIPTEVPLLVPTIAGRTYAVTFFTEDGDRQFNPAYDVQMDTEISTFVAQ